MCLEEQYPTIQCPQKICSRRDLLVKEAIIAVTINTHSFNSPTGLVSKNRIGARRIALNILLCKFRDALRQIT